MRKISLFIIINAISLYIVSNLVDSMYIGFFKVTINSYNNIRFT